MTIINILSRANTAKLSRASYSKAWTNIPYSATADQNQDEVLSKLGLREADFPSYTFTVKAQQGLVPAIFGPRVVKQAGQAKLQWGDKYLNLPADMALQADTSRVYARVHGFDFPVFLAEGVDFMAAKRALKAGDLARVLAEPKGRAFTGKMRDLAPGLYTVTAYELFTDFGQPAVKVLLCQDGLELGWYKGNTRLYEMLEELDPDSEGVLPGELQVDPSTSKTAKGYPIIPLAFWTRAELETTEPFEF